MYHKIIIIAYLLPSHLLSEGWIYSVYSRKPKAEEYLVLSIDYFTRWVEVKVLSSIISKQTQDFFWEDILCRYGIPKILITDNGKKFDVKIFKEFYEGLGIEQRFASMAHPQTNGLAEVTNCTILWGFKKILEGV